MSVEELEARIDKISADIGRQKKSADIDSERQEKVLKDLEHSKSLHQRQLNAVRDPMARLPLELSSQIFLHTLPPLPEPGAPRIPMLLLNVSNAWADIALSMPALWAVIRVVFPRAEGFPELLGIWLKRAHTLPLFLSLSNNFDEGVAPIVRLHAQRLKQLELRHDMDDGPISLFGGSSPGPLPLLDTLTFRRSNHLNDFAYSRAQILELLREAPNLVQCTFDSVKHIDRWANGIHNQLSHGPLVLPNLRSLLFTAPRRHSVPSNDSILTDLTTPRLEALSLSMHKVTGYGVLAFLKRSEPPLRELVLGDWFTSDDVTQLGECLRLVPTLVRFDVYWPFTGDEGAVFHTAFAESVLGSLPTLRSLTVRTNSDDTIIPNSFLETLLLALSSRHTQIAELKIISSTWSSDLKEETRIGFQRLVADGMEVNIGTEARNFISLDPILES